MQQARRVKRRRKNRQEVFVELVISEQLMLNKLLLNFIPNEQQIVSPKGGKLGIVTFPFPTLSRGDL